MNKIQKYLVIIFVLIVTSIIIFIKLHISLSLSDYHYRQNTYLYSYGILVTGATLFAFYISAFKYKDLYEETKKKNRINKEIGTKNNRINKEIGTKNNRINKEIGTKNNRINKGIEPKKNRINKEIDINEAIDTNEAENPFVSIILAVYNEEVIIRKCIDSLLNSNYKNKEIIVVNDCSIDKTKAILDEYKDKITVVCMSKNVGKKKAIAEGIKISKGSIFVFTDSDTVIETDAISKVIEIFKNYPNVGCISGHVGVLNNQENILTKIQDSWYETQFSVKKATESVYGAVCCVSGPLAVFRRESIYNYIPAWVNDTFLGGEFKFATDRTLTGFVLGSKYIGKKLKEKYSDSPFVMEIDYPEKEWEVIYCKSAKAYTIVPNTLNKFMKQNIRWKKSFIRNLFFTGSFYWRKNPVIVCKYYSGVLFTLVGPLIAARHIIFLPFYGNMWSPLLYLGGILTIGALYAIMAKLNNPNCKTWMYRPFMSLLSTLLISWLIFYAIITMKKSVWYRGN